MGNNISTISDNLGNLPSEPIEGFTPHPIQILLVDDQAIIGEAVRRMLAEEKDITLHFCSDPTLALPTAEEIRPNLILQDLIMPEIDGLTLVKNFRANPITANVPMIVLSSKEDPQVKAQAFQLGANDYLVKLPDKIELIARIRYHSESHINLLQRNEAFEALQRSQKALASELAEASEYVRSLLPPPLEGEIQTDWKFITSTSLGGDAFGYHWLDKDHFCFYLLDVCGHGVGAALLSVSAMNTIANRTLPEIDFRKPDQVITSLNRAFPMERQNNMYFTIWYGIWHRPSRKLTYASAGHPPAILVRPSSSGPAEIERLRTPAMPVGTLNGLTFPSDQTTLHPGDTLYVFSDGTYEIKRLDGSMMELEEFIEILAQPAPPEQTKLDAILAGAQSQQQSERFLDDFSIIELKFTI